MKKALILILTLSMLLSCLALPSFADEVSEKEKEEILEFGDEAIRVYEWLTGSCLDAGIFNPTPGELRYQIEVYDVSDVDLDLPLMVYAKSSISMTKSDEFFELLDKYFINYEFDDKMWVFSDTEQDIEIKNHSHSNNYKYFMVEAEGEGVDKMFASNLPYAVIYDGALYTKTHIPLAYTVTFYGDVKSGEIVSYDGKNATIKFNIVDGPNSSYVLRDDVTLELMKTNDGWKVSGGTAFSNYSHSMKADNWFKNPPPPTGENTALYIVIAGAAVVAMTSLAVRKKKKIA